MKYQIQYQYKPASVARPYDYGQTEEIEITPGEPNLVPVVGDTVILTLDTDGRKMYKVLTRNFAYLMKPGDPGYCIINIVVGDVTPDEMAARLKE